MVNFAPRPSALRCIVCTEKRLNHSKAPLLVCSDCKLAAYCSHNHQQMNWSKHKMLCKMVTSLQRAENVDHFLEIIRPIKYEPSGMLHQVKIRSLVGLTLHLNLSMYEMELIYHPNICEICNEYNRKKIKVCPDCQLVSFCIDSHTTEEIDAHKDSCRQLKIFYDLYLEQPIPTFKPLLSKPKQPNEKLPENLVDLIERSTDVKVPILPVNNKEYEIMIATSTFSCLATILFCIEKLKIAEQFIANNEEKMIIHIVGVEDDFRMFKPAQLWLMEYWLPEIKSFQFLLIGPNMNTCDSDKRNHEYEALKYETVLIRSTYQAFCKNHLKSAQQPHLIICFDCGFADEPKDKSKPPENASTWEEAFKCFGNNYKQASIAFTSYTQSEAEYDVFELYSNLAANRRRQVNVPVRCMQNPYKSLNPLRESISKECNGQNMFYINQYLSIITTK